MWSIYALAAMASSMRVTKTGGRQSLASCRHLRWRCNSATQNNKNMQQLPENNTLSCTLLNTPFHHPLYGGESCLDVSPSVCSRQGRSSPWALAYADYILHSILSYPALYPAHSNVIACRSTQALMQAKPEDKQFIPHFLRSSLFLQQLLAACLWQASGDSAHTDQACCTPESVVSWHALC